MMKLTKTFENLKTANLVKITFKLKRGDDCWEERYAFQKELAKATAMTLESTIDAVGMHIELENGQKCTIGWEEEVVVLIDQTNNEVDFSIKEDKVQKGIEAIMEQKKTREDKAEMYEYALSHMIEKKELLHVILENYRDEKNKYSAAEVARELIELNEQLEKKHDEYDKFLAENF